MLMIRPQTIGDSAITSSNIAELPPATWIRETTYAVDDMVTAPRILSSELITNGDFSAGATGWNANTGVVYGSGVATSTAAIIPAEQSNVLVVGQRYRATFSYAKTSGAELQIPASGGNWVSPALANGSSGTFTVDFIANGTSFAIQAANAAYTGTIDNVSVKLLDSSPAAYDVYRSKTAGNLGNDPATSPTNWQWVSQAYSAWDSRAYYKLGDIVPGGLPGSNLVTNSEFTTDLSGWTVSGAGAAWVAGGFARLSPGTYFARDYNYFSAIVGKRYRAVVYIATITGSAQISIGIARDVFNTDYYLGSISLAGTYEFEFIAAQTSYGITIALSSGTGTADIGSVRVFTVDSDQNLYESAMGAGDDVSITIASPGVVTWPSHGLVADTPVIFQTTGKLPTGLAINTLYYVKSPATNTFQVAATVGGAAINTSGSQSGAQSAIANPNVGHDPSTDDGSRWIQIGPTNRWAMFDNVSGTATLDPAKIDLTLTLTGRVDSLALLGLANANSVQVIVSTIAEGTIYNQTFALTSSEGISSWYSWFFEEIKRKTALLVTGLPTYSNPIVRVIITGTGTATLECGNLVVGLSKDLGRTLHDGAQISITDYSRKDVDQYGNYTITKRAFSKRGNFKMRISKAQVDGIHSALADMRATPAVYSASSDYDSTLIFGFYKDFNVEIDYPLDSLVSIDIEGLT